MNSNSELFGFRLSDYICLVVGIVLVYFAGWIKKKIFKWENESLFIRVFIAIIGLIIICLVLYVFP